MKILYIVDSFPSEESKMTGIFTYRQINKLIDQYEIEIIYLRNFSPKRRFVSVEKNDLLKVTTISLPLLMTKYNAPKILNIFLYSLLVKFILRNYNYDIIHSVGGALSGLVGGQLKNKNTRLLVQYNGSDVNVNLKKYKKFKWIRNKIKKVDHYIFVSKNLMDVFTSFFDVPYNECSVIYRGVDLNRFKTDNSLLKKEYKIDKKKNFVFLFLGGFSPEGFPEYGINQKGGVTLINAWKKLESSYDDIELIFGGNNISDSLLTKYGLYSKSVTFIGKVKPEAVLELYKKSDVLIIPSLSEGLPNVLYEAMASGLPVIGTRVGGIPEILINEKGGLLISPNNELELVTSMERLINCENLKNFGQFNLQFAKTNLDSNMSTKKISELYLKLN